MRTLTAVLSAGALVAAAASAGYAIATFGDDPTDNQRGETRRTVKAGDGRCEQAQDSYEAAMQRAESDVVAMKQYAGTHEMWPPSAKDFPELWSAQLGEASIDEVSEWHDLKQTASRSVVVALQIVDDSPECFAPTLVAEVRTSLNEATAGGR